jgi:hypothetical protein
VSPPKILEFTEYVLTPAVTKAAGCGEVEMSNGGSPLDDEG